MNWEAEPLTRAQICNLAQLVRKNTGFEKVLKFPVVKFLEFYMPQMFKGFAYEIVGENDFPKHKHGETDVIGQTIRIREDVYERAIAGEGRDRMTVAHEIAHYLLMVVCGVKFSRTFDNKRVEAFRDPEWQAKALAGELLCFYPLIRGMSETEIAEKCGVSQDAARYAVQRGGTHR